MKINKSITCALLTLGLVSAAGIAKADSTVQIGGVTYNEVFMCGSTAARGNIFNAVTTSLFDGNSYTTVPATGVSSSTGAFDIYGKIGGVNYCLCFDWTGSEAGLWALQHLANGIPNPIAGSTLNGNPGYPNAVIPGTPSPNGFVDPTGNGSTLLPAEKVDLAMSDTSQSVSLSPVSLGYAALLDYGCVGAVTFEWCKGNNTSPDSSWNHMVNITDPQANYLMSGPQHAYFITGNPGDGDDVYCVGRNKASGTHQNTCLDTLHGTTVAVDQYVANSCTYNSSGQLTLGNTNSLVSQGGIDEVFNDGFDSGSGVSGTLVCDEAGYNDGNTNVVMVGYLGIGDANNAIKYGAVKLSLNGVYEDDAAVEDGNYSFWGHEHLYATPSADSTVKALATALVGSNNGVFGSGSTLGGALAAGGQLGGGGAGTAQSTIIAPKYMAADKPSGGDAGYAAPLQ